MRVITFANHKGGVGKTTSTLTVGQELARRGQRVLFLDCDPQHNLTLSFAANVATHLGTVIRGEGTLKQIIVGVDHFCFHFCFHFLFLALELRYFFPLRKNCFPFYFHLSDISRKLHLLFGM